MTVISLPVGTKIITMNPPLAISYRIDRYDVKNECWSIARVKIDGIDAAKRELQAMTQENMGCRLRLIKIASTIELELES